MIYKGIDVSAWQKDIDYGKVKATGIDFVIIRAGYGKGHRDKYFDQNYQRAKAAGLHAGAYWYSYADSVEDARKEAQSFASVLSGKQLDYPVYFDIEEKKQLNRGRDFCSALVMAFCTEMERLGYFTGFYASVSAMNSLLSGTVKSRFSAWVAQWSNACTYRGTHGMWQYSSKGTVPGVTGYVDLDYAYIDFPQTILSSGLNGYSSKEPADVVNPIDAVARAVIHGRYGNGAVRRRQLRAAGYDPDVVQKRVNELLE